ncbi:MAG: autotransporter domain-containing protein [Candidatus Omnitrophica bacterium]|nr:autotransporter domain-containing protein [Candidatus Omnitrophota bacterium]
MHAQKKISCRHFRAVGFLLVFYAVLFFSITPSHADTFSVDNRADTLDPGTLRTAITGLNASGAGTIQFDAGAAGTIPLAGALPTLNFETIFNLSNNDVTVTGFGGDTADGVWLKFDNGATDTGTFTFGAGTVWSVGGGLAVGYEGEGRMVISGGGSLSVTGGGGRHSFIGDLATSEGAITVTGTDSTWTNNVDIFVGNHGTGSLTISDGGLVSDTWGNIGGEAGSTGTVTVTGIDSFGNHSTWTNSGGMLVGNSGTGTLTISDGGTVDCTALTVGNNDSGELHITNGGAMSNTYADIGYNDDGTVTVDGSTSTWTNSSEVNIGKAHTGTLTVTSGGTVTSTKGYIGKDATGDGIATVDDPNSKWTCSEELIVADNGTGELHITNGGEVSNTWANVGNNAVGHVYVEDANSKWTNSGDVNVGQAAIGTLEISNSGTVSSSNGYIGKDAAGDGTVTVEDADSKWTITDNLVVGTNGEAELTIQNGGEVSDATSWVGANAGSSGIATVTGANSKWTHSDDLYVGSGATGSLTISDGGLVSDATGNVSGYAGGNGTVKVTGADSTWTNTDTNGLYVGRTQNGGAATGDLTISDGGTVNVAGGAGTTTIGSDVGSTGTLNIGEGGAAGALNTAEVNGGDGGATVKFNHTDAAYAFAPLLTGSLNVQHTGSGTTTLSGNNTYTGVTTISGGTVSVATIRNGGEASNLGAATNAAANLVLDGGTLRYTGLDASTDRNVTINAAKTTLIDITVNTLTMTGGDTGLGGNGAVTKTGAGTLVLKGAFTNTGLTTITAGTLQLGDGFSGASNILNNATLSFNRTTNLDAAAVLSGTGILRQDGTGTTTLSGINTYTGPTEVNAGTLKAGAVDQAFGIGSAVSVATGANLDLNGFDETIGSLSGDGTVTNGGLADGALTAGDATSTTFSGIIKDGGTNKTLFIKEGLGVLTLSGANTYTGLTEINTGTLQVSNANAVGGGALTNSATLSVGTISLSVPGIYTQNAGSALDLTANSSSAFGNITSVADAVVDAGSTVNVTVSGYIPNNATLKIIDGAGGAGVNVPATITSSNSKYTFIGSSSAGDLILTVNRSGTGFSSSGTNSNTSAVGAALDNVTNPSADMTTVLDALDVMTPAQVEQSLETVTPVVDSGVTNISNTAINQFMATTTDRLEDLFARAHDEDTGDTGVSTGSEGLNGVEAWGRGFGEYVRQDARGLSNGYRATIWGTAIGGDLPAFNNRARFGASGGYAASNVNSKDNSGKTNINSYQTTLYGGYIDAEKPYYLNGAFSFAYNTYKGKRNITVGAIQRRADSNYRGQQYAVLVDGGYTFKTKNVNITPVASLEYVRLHLQSYTETGADALNLSVTSQDYDMLQSGLGMKLDHTFEVESGFVIPEIHAKWLYDFIGDKQETTSTFSGGGGSFATNGFDPAQNSLNVGSKLTLVTRGNWSLDANYDFEYKQDYTSHTGWADVRYKF